MTVPEIDAATILFPIAVANRVRTITPAYFLGHFLDT
jgi:hypothetical protein